LRVDIAMEEKNGCEVSVVGVGRLFECRVISDRSKAIKKVVEGSSMARGHWSGRGLITL
jgi:hypothetical protein